MAISFNAGAGATAASIAMPSHQAGDLLVIHAAGFSAVTPPAGWTTPTNGSASNNGLFSVVAYKLAASGSEVSGTWTNAAIIDAAVYRGTSGSIVACTKATGAGTAISYPALTLSTLASTSWAGRAALHSAATDVHTAALTGYTQRVTAFNNNVVIKDSNAGLSSNPGVDAQTVNTTGDWLVYTWEMAIPVVAGDTHGLLAMF